MSCRPANTQPKRYLVGNVVTVTVILTDSEGNIVDPANLRMLVAGPSDTNSTIIAMTENGDQAIGTFTPDEAGIWSYRVETFAGTVEAAVERTLIAVTSIVPSP